MLRWIYWNCKGLFLISFKMTNNYEENEAKLDKLLLIFRRLFLILFILFLLRILLFKIFKINKSSTENENTEIPKENIEIKDKEIEIENKKIEESSTPTTNEKWKKNLWKNYSIDKNNVLYKGEIIKFADSENFRIIDKKELEWREAINSDSLLDIFADYNTRVVLMKNIDKIIESKENITLELKNSSENWMYKMKNDYKNLSQFDRWDRYEMTDEQRAKFAIMFLYIKIIKNYNNDQATMERALEELKFFLENFDKKDLVKEKNLKKIKWDLGIDNDCLYVNGELYACFLDNLFAK